MHLLGWTGLKVSISIELSKMIPLFDDKAINTRNLLSFAYQAHFVQLQITGKLYEVYH